MFTGIIEDLRPIVSLTRGGASGALTVDLGTLAEDAHVGDSIAINGICLTVAACHASEVTFDVSTETLSKTAFSVLTPHDQVNVERSLRVGDRLGGHFVTGHIDGVGSIVTKRRDPGQWSFEFNVDASLCGMLIEKGSVAVDGISLTVVDLRQDTFAAAVIPHTFDHTTLGLKSERDPVNIETDVLGKWIKKLATTPDGGSSLPTSLIASAEERAASPPLTEDKLREAGFI